MLGVCLSGVEVGTIPVRLNLLPTCPTAGACRVCTAPCGACPSSPSTSSTPPPSTSWRCGVRGGAEGGPGSRGRWAGGGAGGNEEAVVVRTLWGCIVHLSVADLPLKLPTRAHSHGRPPAGGGGGRAAAAPVGDGYHAHHAAPPGGVGVRGVLWLKGLGVGWWRARGLPCAVPGCLTRLRLCRECR